MLCNKKYKWKRKYNFRHRPSGSWKAQERGNCCLWLTVRWKYASNCVNKCIVPNRGVLEFFKDCFSTFRVILVTSQHTFVAKAESERCVIDYEIICVYVWRDFSVWEEKYRKIICWHAILLLLISWSKQHMFDALFIYLLLSRCSLEPQGRIKWLYQFTQDWKASAQSCLFAHKILHSYTSIHRLDYNYLTLALYELKLSVLFIFAIIVFKTFLTLMKCYILTQSKS